MVQLKMRPIFSRGNSMASISVAAPKPDDDGSGDNDDTTLTHDEREGGSPLTGSPLARPRSPLRRRRRRVLDADAHVSFSDDVTVHPPGDALTDKELKAYFYTVDDLKRFDRDRALTALMYRSGKHPNGGDGPWDDNVHSIRGLEDFLCGVPSSRNQYFSGGSSPTPSSSASSGSSLSSYRASSTDRERERREHTRTILMEQERLRSEGRDLMSGSLVLREVSVKSSCESRREALERGRDDAHAVCRLDAAAANNSDGTTNVLRAVRGRLYALMEKQPSLRSLGSADRQTSQRNLLSMDRQPSLRSLLGGGEKQTSVRNLLGGAPDKSP